MKRANVGVIQRGNGAGLTLETIGELGGRDFDRDLAIESGVAGAMHLAHAARADDREDLVAAEFFTRRKGHTVRLILARIVADPR